MCWLLTRLPAFVPFVFRVRTVPAILSNTDSNAIFDRGRFFRTDDRGKQRLGRRTFQLVAEGKGVARFGDERSMLIALPQRVCKGEKRIRTPLRDVFAVSTCICFIFYYQDVGNPIDMVARDRRCSEFGEGKQRSNRIDVQ